MHHLRLDQGAINNHDATPRQRDAQSVMDTVDREACAEPGELEIRYWLHRNTDTRAAKRLGLHRLDHRLLDRVRRGPGITRQPLGHREREEPYRHRAYHEPPAVEPECLLEQRREPKPTDRDDRKEPE